ncbi:hypothetical protein GQS40_12155|uniref:Uncharacterized protein n=1 Tax=Leuconostoc lactis TaxID=1246 RepID=A0A6L7AC84_LEULA|nr:hypothetical protein [Leuconostoc lactis]
MLLTLVAKSLAWPGHFNGFWTVLALPIEIYAFTLFFFIIVANEMGMLLQLQGANGVTYVKSPTADPIVTMTLAVMTLMVAHGMGVQQLGFKGYLNGLTFDWGTIISTLLAMAIVVIVSIVLTRQLSIRPGKRQNLIEYLLDFTNNIVDGQLPQKQARQFGLKIIFFLDFKK